MVSTYSMVCVVRLLYVAMEIVQLEELRERVLKIVP
jgi:hypothetical protein